MKLSALLPLLLTCALLKNSFEEKDFTCRSRPSVDLRGGPGCQITCRAKESTCEDVGDNKEVCGKLRTRLGVYALGKFKVQFCLIPEGGFLPGLFGRYCVTIRFCALRNEICGCRVVADGRPCICRVKTIDGEQVPVTNNCPILEQGDDSFGQPSIMSALLPSEEDFKSEMSMHITDVEAVDKLDEAYSLFLGHIDSL